MIDPERITAARMKARGDAKRMHWMFAMAETARWAGHATEAQATEAAKASGAALDRLVAFERAEAAMVENTAWHDLFGTDYGADRALASCERELLSALSAIEGEG